MQNILGEGINGLKELKKEDFGYAFRKHDYETVVDNGRVLLK